MMAALVITCLVALWVTNHALDDFKLITFPTSTIWWAKKISDEVFTAGRLSEQQVRDAKEAGFESLISLLAYDLAGLDGVIFPKTDLMSKLAQEVGLHFEVLLEEDTQSWHSEEAIATFLEAYRRCPKPILFFCQDAHQSTFIALLNYAAISSAPYLYQERVLGKDDFYERAAMMGFDYTRQKNMTSLVEKLTGVDDVRVSPLKPGFTAVRHHWYWSAWFMKPIYRNWFVCGQFESSNIPLIEMAGITKIINLRGLKQDGGSSIHVGYIDLSQVSNNKDGDDRPLLQRILEYLLNYDLDKHLEFGSGPDYEEEIEKREVEKSPALTYYNTPVGNFTKMIWRMYKETWLDAAKPESAVLVHCEDSMQAAKVALLGSGWQYGKSSDWALNRAASLGYDWDDVTQNVFRVLDSNPDHRAKKKTICGHHGATCGVQALSMSICSTLLIVVTALFLVMT